ncbi:glycosyltransferase [Candidatus Thioglobus sp.]|nr:glycosyltransferase [Candidatus Thioglobus sp.]
MKVSIITVVWNNKETIKDSINSVLNQTYADIEYIVVDGSSSDGTVDIVKGYVNKISHFISEPDEGIYDALNKGIELASGDVIGILHSDDLFSDRFVVSDMMERMAVENAEIAFSDMVIVDNSMTKVLRYYMASYFSPWMFKIGWMPPHPTCFIKKSLFDEFGMYSLDYKVAGDFDFLVRIFYARDISWTYLDRVTVKMRQGGVSNIGFSSKKIIAKEINQSLRSNNVWSPPIFQLGRYFIRLLELFIRPKSGYCE